MLLGLQLSAFSTTLRWNLESWMLFSD